MANTKHFNSIKIARGTRANWLAGANPSYGEMFYDINTKGVYITIPNADAENGIELKRFGGFDSVVLKGTIQASNFANICKIAESGDAYIVTGAINVVQPEITFDNKGNVVRNESSVRTYDDYFKNGQVIIFTSEDVSNIPNAYIFNESEIAESPEGVKGIITLAGSVEIVDKERLVPESFNKDGTATSATVQETQVTTDKANRTIRVEAPNAVLESKAIPAHNLSQAGGNRSLVESDLFVNDTKHDSNYKTGDDRTHNTEIIGKKKDGTQVTVEFPNKDGMIQVIGEGDGTKDVLPKFDEEGALIDSEVSQTNDATTGNGTFRLGENFDINYDELAKLLKYLRGTVKITRLFDHDDANINSESQAARTHDENTLVVLDEDSAIDGGEWE